MAPPPTGDGDILVFGHLSTQLGGIRESRSIGRDVKNVAIKFMSIGWLG